jgi:TetR/AcrR family transcriptional repressor of nem operon
VAAGNPLQRDPDRSHQQMAEPATRRGKDTKRRIVAVAAELMYERGVSAVSVGDVLTASGTGKSQFYHYFSNKEELVAEVLWHQLDQVLEDQSFFQLDTWDGIQAWFQALIALQQTRRDFRGCPLGSLTAEVLDQSDHLRSQAAEAFAHWETALAAALERMRGRGLLPDDAKPQILAETTIAILQGGYLLTSTKRDVTSMRHTVIVALAHLQSFASSPADQGHNGGGQPDA